MPDLKVLSGINAILELVTFEEVVADTFRLAGVTAPWLLEFCPTLATQDTVILKNDFAFLGSFIEQSREYFQSSDAGSLGSGPWSERDLKNVEHNLSATAVNLGERLAIQIRRIPNEQLYHRRIFQKAREYSLEYERLSREKEQKELLIYAIVHDLSGPLTAVAGIVELLSSYQNDPLTVDKMYGLARKQIDVTHKLIRSILEVFDAQTNKFDPANLNPTQAPQIYPLVENVVANFYPVFKQQGAELELISSLDSEPIKVISEGEQLSRVITNLLENSLRYSPVNSRVTVTLEKQGNEISIAIADQGKGVPAELIESLFQRFVGGKEFGGKSGFGLYYCQMCVKRWGGRIEHTKPVDSQGHETNGACFKVTLQQHL